MAARGAGGGGGRARRGLHASQFELILVNLGTPAARFYVGQCRRSTVFCIRAYVHVCRAGARPAPRAAAAAAAGFTHESNRRAAAATRQEGSMWSPQQPRRAVAAEWAASAADPVANAIMMADQVSRCVCVRARVVH
eukprot:COSAG02_NODE_3005_length_7570_cov_3.554812_5_plen_137_part_00